MSTQSNQEVNDKERKNISKKINDFRLWTHSQNLKNEDIISKAVHNQTTIKQYSSELNEEENNQNRKKIKKGKTIMKNKVLYNSNANLSENVQKILSDVSKTINNINQSTEEIKKLNALYLINTSQKLNKKENLNEEDKSFLPPIKEDKHATNFKYINDNYRRQLNKAFLNFNPIIHLGNLSILRKADPDIDRDIQNLTKHIDDDLAEITNKNYYHNLYEKIIQQNKKRKNKLDSMTTAPTQPTEANKVNNTSVYKPIFRKKMRNRMSVEVKKKFPDKELEEKTMNLMNNALTKISTTLNEENMNKYFNDYKSFSNMEIKQQSHLYFPGMETAADILKEIQYEKIIRDLNEKTNRRKKLLNAENETFIKDILEGKKNLLKEIERQEKL